MLPNEYFTDGNLDNIINMMRVFQIADVDLVLEVKIKKVERDVDPDHVQESVKRKKEVNPGRRPKGLVGANLLFTGMYRHRASSTSRHCSTRRCRQLDKYQPIL